MVTGIDHVQIAAPEGCEAEARNFFGRMLGLEELEKPEGLRARGGCWFRVGAQQIHVGVEREFRAATKAHPAIAVEKIEDAWAVLERAGVKCAWDEAIVGVRRFYVHDPWGNRLEFTEPSGAPK